MFDSHVHAAPDVLPRLGDDLAIGQTYLDAGYSGYVLKGHYEPTVGRAQAVARATGLRVYGGVALNQHVGGINPAAVSATLGAGGRVVWFPTADAHTQRTAGLPRLHDQDPRLADSVYGVPPVDPAGEEPAEQVLRLIGEADAVLATGHLSGPECHWLASRAPHHGIDRVLFIHPSYTVPGLGPSEIAELAATGGHIEITTYQLLHQPGCTPEMLAAVARAAGPKLVLASDAGQQDTPNPPDALQLLVDTLAAEGLDRSWLVDAASIVPEALFSPR